MLTTLEYEVITYHRVTVELDPVLLAQAEADLGATPTGDLWDALRDAPQYTEVAETTLLALETPATRRIADEVGQ